MFLTLSTTQSTSTPAVSQAPQHAAPFGDESAHFEETSCVKDGLFMVHHGFSSASKSSAPVFLCFFACCLGLNKSTRPTISLTVLTRSLAMILRTSSHMRNR